MRYVSIRHTARLAEAGTKPSVGSVGDGSETARAGSVIGLFKTEAIRRPGLWRGLEAVECATPASVDWLNTRHMPGPIGSIRPAEAEVRYHADRDALALAA